MSSVEVMAGVTTPGDLILEGKYRLVKRIGFGSFGDIFLAVDVRNGEEVAIKVEELDARHPQLRHEQRILKALKGIDGIPELKYFGQYENHKFVVMEILGPSLEDLFNYCSRQFTVKTVLMLADQMINLLEAVHDKNFIHRDVKPDNFLMGLAQKSSKVHLIDFGLSKRYRDVATQLHIPYREDKCLVGTARFASLNAHQGVEQSRRDDMEALGHCFIYFLRGILPWQGITGATNKQKHDKVASVKLSTSIESLCSGVPDEFAKYLAYCRQLTFWDAPDYFYCRQLFQALFSRLEYQRDLQFDWILLCRQQQEMEKEREEEAVAAKGIDDGKGENAVDNK